MSSYERYDQTSVHYDSTRWPTGIEIVLGCLGQSAAPLNQMTVLDAGCGTGNYAEAVLPHVAKIIAVDRSDGMLEVARQKLAAAADSGRISFHQGEIDALPLPDASVDGVMINQVLHHLPDVGAEDWPAHRRVFTEFARVLKPGGVLTVNTCSHRQIEHAYWPYHLIPKAVEELLRRFMPLEQIEAALAEKGLRPRGRFVPVDAILQGADYLDPRGPLRREWRAGDSIWALVGEDELGYVERTLRDLEARDALDGYVAEHDAPRPHLGQITILYAVKS